MVGSGRGSQILKSLNRKVKLTYEITDIYFLWCWSSKKLNPFAGDGGMFWSNFTLDSFYRVDS